MSQQIVTIHLNSEAEFTEKVNAYLINGFRVSSTSCGFANSEIYDFCNIYQAILVKD